MRESPELSMAITSVLAQWMTEDQKPVMAALKKVAGLRKEVPVSSWGAFQIGLSLNALTELMVAVRCCMIYTAEKTDVPPHVREMIIGADAEEYALAVGAAILRIVADEDTTLRFDEETSRMLNLMRAR